MRLKPIVASFLMTLLIPSGPVAAKPPVGIAAQLNPIPIEASSQQEPAPASIASAYPDASRRSGTEGVAFVKCAIQKDSHFGDCSLLREDPPSAGFGGAALLLAPHVQQTIPDGHGGARTEGLVIVPFSFVVKETKFSVPPQQLTWLRKPTGEDMARAFPDAAVRAGQEARTAISCRFQPDGYLTNCIVIDEAPFGWSFDKAALEIAPKFRAMPTMKDGSPLLAGKVVHIPILWRLPH
jgi:hypothetical protein